MRLFCIIGILTAFVISIEFVGTSSESKVTIRCSRNIAIKGLCYITPIDFNGNRIEVASENASCSTWKDGESAILSVSKGRITGNISSGIYKSEY